MISIFFMLSNKVPKVIVFARQVGIMFYIFPLDLIHDLFPLEEI